MRQRLQAHNHRWEMVFTPSLNLCNSPYAMPGDWWEKVAAKEKRLSKLEGNTIQQACDWTVLPWEWYFGKSYTENHFTKMGLPESATIFFFYLSSIPMHRDLEKAPQKLRQEEEDQLGRRQQGRESSLSWPPMTRRGFPQWNWLQSWMSRGPLSAGFWMSLLSGITYKMITSHEFCPGLEQREKRVYWKYKDRKIRFVPRRRPAVSKKLMLAILKVVAEKWQWHAPRTLWSWLTVVFSTAGVAWCQGLSVDMP